jgi:glycosyltransferase involved in cell wall biosynthesis
LTATEPTAIPSKPAAIAPIGRVVMFVMNTVTHDSRVLREATTLRDAGWWVTIVGRLPSSATDVAPHETYQGLTIVRVPQSVAWRVGWRQRMSLLRYPWRGRDVIAASLRRDLIRGRAGLPSFAGRLAGLVVSLPWVGYRLVDQYAFGDRLPTPRREGALEWLMWWRHTANAWAAAAADAAPQADVYHGHDLTGLAAAVRAGRIHGAKVVYDSHEIYLDSGTNAARPRWARSIVGLVEGRWARSADALLTVNHALARHLGKRFGRRAFFVVHNCPPRFTPGSGVDRLRAAAGIAPSEPVVLYHGRLARDRGIDRLCVAMLQEGLESAHLVFLGYGPLEPALLDLAAEPRFGGRLHVLAAVPPDDLLGWIATVDVDAIPILPTTLNHRLGTPNKLFESIAAGVPVVVSDFPVMRHIVLDDPLGPLGAVCDPADPDSIAAALGSILNRSDEERAQLRDRCSKAAAARWNWETESQALLSIYDLLVR